MEVRPVPIANLRLDYENPRLESIQKSHRETMAAVMQTQGDKLVNLAAHIVDYGVNPLERTLVMPDLTDERLYIVLEGNRRVMALRLLANPELGTGVLRQTETKRLKQLHDAFQKNPIELLEVVVAADRDEADPWIQIKHKGESGGAGTVTWGSIENDRYEARRGSKSVELQIIDFVAAKGKLDRDTKASVLRMPITNLRRLLRTQGVRDKLGLVIDRKNHAVEMRYPEGEMLKGLRKMVVDFATGEKNVGDIYTESDRLNYIDKFRANELPSKATTLAAPQPLPEAETASMPPAPKKAARAKAERVTLAPKSPAIAIKEDRVRRIYVECQQLRVETFPNACSVLFRVFLELSIDSFIQRHSVSVKSKRSSNPTLVEKVTAVAVDMETSQIMTRAQLKPVRSIVSNKHLSASVDTLNAYVHSANLHPRPSDLIPAWDDLDPFFRKLWA